MHRLAAFGLLLLIDASYGAVNLLPEANGINDYTSDGATYTQLRFTDDKRHVEYIPPAHWSYRGSPAELILTPDKPVGATAAIQVLPVARESGPEAARARFVSSLPAAAEAVTIIAEQENPILLGGDLHSYEVRGSYQLGGDTYLRSCLFVDLPDAQLCFRLTATKKDFVPLYHAFNSSVLSWRWVDPPAQGENSEKAPEGS